MTVVYSKRQQILEAFRDRLREIRQTNDFQTDAGLNVLLGDPPMLGPDDPEVVIAVIPQDTQLQSERFEVLPIEVQAVTNAKLDDPHVAAEAVLADVAQAIELDDKTLGGLVKHMDIGSSRTIPREPGSLAVGIGVTYNLTYVRVWGEP